MEFISLVMIQYHLNLKCNMAYDAYLEERMSRILDSKKVEYTPKKMMGGLCYMVNEKMCFGIVKDQMMARIHPDIYEESLKVEGVQ